MVLIMKLIRKGQFRERANRHRHYHQSENHQAKLTSHNYIPISDAHSHRLEETLDNTHHIEKISEDEK